MKSPEEIDQEQAAIARRKRTLARRYRAKNQNVLFPSLDITVRKARALMQILTDPELFKYFQQNDMWRIFWDTEKTTGLLEGSIIQNPLFHPDKDGNMTSSGAVAGRYVGYDFDRPAIFGAKGERPDRRQRTGRIVTYLLPELKGDPDEYTPVGYISRFNPYHQLHLDTPDIGTLEKRGLIRQTTYQEAYEDAGLWRQHAKWLQLAGLANSSVYTVTPRGNGVIYLAADRGISEKKVQKSGVLRPVFQF